MTLIFPSGRLPSLITSTPRCSATTGAGAGTEKRGLCFGARVRTTAEISARDKGQWLLFEQVFVSQQLSPELSILLSALDSIPVALESRYIRNLVLLVLVLIVLLQHDSSLTQQDEAPPTTRIITQAAFQRSTTCQVKSLVIATWAQLLMMA